MEGEERAGRRSREQREEKERREVSNLLSLSRVGLVTLERVIIFLTG